MATENEYFQIGNVASPVTGSSANPTLNDLDPALNAVLTFFPTVIEEHLGSRWDDEVTRLGLDSLSGSIVAQALPYDPLPLAKENAWQFPLFAVYPTRSTYEQTTQAWYHIRREMDVLYMMPPLRSEQGERLYPFITQIERVLVDRTNEGFDDASGGFQHWKACGIERITIKDGTYGKVPRMDSEEFFPTLQVRIEVVERRNPFVGNFEAFAGVLSGSIDIASGSADGGDISGPVTDFITFQETIE